MIDGALFYSACAAAMVLASTIYFLSSNHRRSARHLAANPIFSISSETSTMKVKKPEIISAKKVISPTEKSAIPTDMPTPPPSPSSATSRRKPSISTLITNILPSRRGSIESPANSVIETPVGGPPVINRSREEIEAYGDFPNYAALSGVRLPEPYPEFKIEQALPRPYRPFRWSYHQTMGFWKMQPDWWLELENTYIERIKQRKELFDTHGNAVLGSLPGSEAACKELMEMCLQFLVARYPQYFSLASTTPDQGSVPDLFVNKILDKEFHLRKMDPLVVLLENVPEDFAITLQDTDSGLYVFKAGIICSSLGWSLGTKLGKTLAEIHEPVPDYKEKLKFSVDRFFTKLSASAPIQRGSWGIEAGEPLFKPPGDQHEATRLSQDPKLTISNVNLRVDWQTLRRIPLSGAVVFNFKALFTPVSEFRDEPGVPQLVAKVLREGKKNLMEYKGTWHVEHVALPLFDQWSDEQMQNGLVDPEWQVATLEESPWFRGWEEKWRLQQGF